MQPLYSSQGYEYFSVDIVAERHTRRGTEYQVAWNGVDDQGRPYKKDWIPKEQANSDAVDAWEETKRKWRLHRNRGRRPLTSAPCSPRGIRIRSNKRPQINSSQSEGTNSNEQVTQSVLNPLFTASTERFTAGFRVCKRFSHVEIIKSTHSQKQDGAYRATTRDNSSSPLRRPELEIPDSQPESLSSEQPGISRDTNSDHIEGNLPQLASSPGRVETLSQVNSPKRFVKEVEPSYPELSSTPILQPTDPYERSRDPSSCQLRTPSPFYSTSQAFETQIAISRNDPAPTIEGEEDTILEDSGQDGQGPGYDLPPDSIIELETLSFTGSGQKETKSSSSPRKYTVLSEIDPNSQSSRISHTQSGKGQSQVSKASDDRFVSIRSHWTTPAQTAQENIEHSIYKSADEISQDMAGFRPSIPSLLNNTPPRPNSSGPPVLREQLRNARALSAANTTSLRASFEAGQARQDSRSPSIIPEPIQYRPVGDSRLEPQIVDLPLPRHPNQLSPHAPHKPSKLSSPPQTAQVDIITQLEPPDLGSATYTVPLSLPGRVREQYLSTIGDYRRATNNLVSVPYPDAATVKDVETMIVRLNNVSNHVDLDDDTTIDHEPQGDEFNWAVTVSAKFQFLNHLLGHLQQDSMHIAIIAQQGLLLDIIGRFIEFGRMARFAKLVAGGQAVEQRYGESVSLPLRVTLLPSGSLKDLKHLSPADLLIAFDSTFDSSAPSVGVLRRHSATSGGLSPVVYPIVYAAVEHIERCVPTMKSSIDQLRVVTQCVLQTRQDMGELQPEEAKPDAAAEEVASFIRLGGQERDWTLLQIRNIQLVGLELEVANQGYPPMVGIEQAMEPASRKRNMDALDNHEALAKRQRMTPLLDATHISNSLPSQDSEVGELQAELTRAKTALNAEQEAHANSRAKLQSLIDQKEEEVRQHMAELGNLQTRFEQLNRDSSSTRDQKKDLERDVARLDERYTKLLADYTAARDERKAVQNLLEEARNRLEKSEVPEIAEFQRLQSENEKLLEEKAVADRRAASAQQDREYAQSVYQEASSSAVEAKGRVQELESKLVEYQSLATGEAFKLKSKNNDDEIKQYNDALDKANTENEDLREQLRRRERGRGMNTRAGSTAPRSPRPGNSPTRSRANSRAPGSTSRPVSPIRTSFFGTRKARGMAD